MKAILIKEYGGPEQLYIGETPTPVVTANDVRIKTTATALNRADLLQRQGLYPPPAGASDIPGLEVSGRIEARGEAVAEQWQIGDEVCALLPAGGYAEKVSVPQQLLMRVPKGVTLVDAAAIPEAFLTAFQALIWLGKLQANERVLIHAGASGVGTAAIQLAKRVGAEVFVTASAGKHTLCKELGADHTIDYKKQNFAEEVHARTRGQGVHVIIDFIGGPYAAANLNSLSVDGRMVVLAFMGGAKTEDFNFAKVLAKRIHIMGSTLRARSLDYKARLTKEFLNFAGDGFSSGQLKPVIDSRYPFNDVASAHAHMGANKNQGKILLVLPPDFDE